MRINGFDECYFIIKYRPGRENTAADAMYTINNENAKKSKEKTNK